MTAINVGRATLLETSLIRFGIFFFWLNCVSSCKLFLSNATTEKTLVPYQEPGKGIPTIIPACLFINLMTLIKVLSFSIFIITKRKLLMEYNNFFSSNLIIKNFDGIFNNIRNLWIHRALK